MTRPRVAAIVPAYNEGGRITAVLDVISQARQVDEILVVTDGCTDGTNDEVSAWLEGRDKTQRPAARLFALTQNIGKGGAMTYGAHRTDADVLLFLDADLIGLRPEQVDELLAPTLMADNPADMALGLFGSVRGGILGWWLGFCHRFTPSITGQRAIRRDLFLEVPGLTHSRYGVEAAITRFVTSDPGLRTDYVFLHSVTHPIKEEKQGAWKGFSNRMRMYREIGSYLISDSCQRHANQLVARYREGEARLRERLGNK